MNLLLLVAILQLGDASCVTSWTEARPRGYGFDHVVGIKSACSRTATCSVSTSANPSPTTVTVAPGATEEVVTYRSSPVRAFTAKVACRLGS